MTDVAHRPETTRHSSWTFDLIRLMQLSLLSLEMSLGDARRAPSALVKLQQKHDMHRLCCLESVEEEAQRQYYKRFRASKFDVQARLQSCLQIKSQSGSDSLDMLLPAYKVKLNNARISVAKPSL